MDITGAGVAEVEDIAAGSGADYAERLSIRDGDETHRVPVADIDWVDAAGDYMCVHVGETTHIMRITMKQLESLLNPKIFKRIHRSTIINADRVEKLQSLLNGEFMLTLSCGAQLKMSRSYKATAKELM